MQAHAAPPNRLSRFDCGLADIMDILQAEINTWVVLSVALPGMTSDPYIALPAAAVGGLLAIGTAGLTVS